MRERRGNMIKKLKNLIPSYAVIPICLVAACNFAAYYFSKLIIADRYKYDLSIPLDDMIPLVTPFIVIYILAYAQWAIGYIVLVRQSRELCARVAASNLIAKTMCFLIFIIVPTAIVRPEVAGNDIFTLLTKFIYAADTPVNLFPSIHCLESYVIMRFTLAEKNLPKAYKIVTAVFSILVFASVVFTKQHIFIDIPGGILIFELGLIISRLTGFYKVFDRKSIDNKLK